MLVFYSSAFAESIQCLHVAAKRVEGLSTNNDNPKHAGVFVLHCLANLKQSLGKLRLSTSLTATRGRLEDRVERYGLADEQSRALFLALLEEFEIGVIIELRSHLYLAVPHDQRELWEQSAPPFGEAVARRFGDASEDVAAACRCLALDEWTAAVFHLMRVVEHGLRYMADKVGHTFPTPVEYQEWGTIIENLDAVIKRAVAALPKRTHEKSDASEFYSRALSQTYHFKDAWRNHVSHSRKTYDSREAERVFISVKSFMQVLAENP